MEASRPRLAGARARRGRLACTLSDSLILLEGLSAFNKMREFETNVLVGQEPCAPDTPSGKGTRFLPMFAELTDAQIDQVAAVARHSVDL